MSIVEIAVVLAALVAAPKNVWGCIAAIALGTIMTLMWKL
jgi:hypothetical protein